MTGAVLFVRPIFSKRKSGSCKKYSGSIPRKQSMPMQGGCGALRWCALKKTGSEGHGQLAGQPLDGPIGVRLLSAVLQDLLGVVVAHGRLIVEHFEIGILEQLGMTLTQELPDRLLHAGIIHFALPGRFAR